MDLNGWLEGFNFIANMTCVRFYCFTEKFIRCTIPVAAVIEADVVEDIVCIVVKLVEDCSSDV